MKRKSIISLLVFCMGLGLTTTSCEDMLSPDSERHSYEVAKDTLYSYWGILRSLQNVAEKYVILGELRGDMVQGTSYVSDTIKAIAEFGQNGYADKLKDGTCVYTCAADYYHIINSCNAYLANCDTMRTTSLNQKYMIYEYAQVEAIRAWVYLQLVQIYGEVPFYLDPLLTTDKINAFMNNPSHQVANADNLADLLEGRLVPMEQYELWGSEGFEQYIFPQYEKYGYTSTVCHSTKCMFPISLVLADIYLLKGDSESCKKAAQHYYTYLNTTNAGPLMGRNYFCTGDTREGEDKPLYGYPDIVPGTRFSAPWGEKDKVSKTTEAITAIPSNVNKNWGRVNRDINRLFGFTAEIYVGVSDSKETASIGLTSQYEHELSASKAYEALCDSQKYEIYIGTYEDPMQQLVVLPEVGDARQYWNEEYRWYSSDDETKFTHLITKQNANGYSTVYPMIYRKSMVWLRYAEALNRAGYPSYAFAILKNGLCNNDTWLPDPETGYAIKDTLFCYVNDVDTLEMDSLITADSSEELSQKVYAAVLAAGGDSTAVKLSNAYYEAKSLENYPDAADPSVCYYIDRRERLNDQPFINFKTFNMRAQDATIPIYYKEDLYARHQSSQSYPATTSLGDQTNNITIGIHQRGCGRIAYDERNSSYDYVKKVAEKVEEKTGTVLTKEDIYSGNYDAEIQDAVETLIVDEMGLELAFEGTRFFDLLRAARRQGPEFFAERVAKRNGEMDNAMYTTLLNQKNWYLPLPTVGE